MASQHLLDVIEEKVHSLRKRARYVRQMNRAGNLEKLIPAAARLANDIREETDIGVLHQMIFDLVMLDYDLEED